MVYSKIFDQNLSSGGAIDGVPAFWEYLFGTHLPATGWTTEGPFDGSGGQSPSITADRYWFLRKTLEFTDGTTDEIHFVVEPEYSGSDLNYYTWDGIKATTDTSDPDYGMGIVAHSDSTFLGWGAGSFQLWADEGDSWFLIKNGLFIGMWLPNGGWVRQDFANGAGKTDGDYISKHLINLPLVDDGKAIYGNNDYTMKGTLPVEWPLDNKLTDFVGIDGSVYAMWRDVGGQMLGRASSFDVSFSNYPKLIRIGDEDGGTYWFGPAAVDNGFSILFNVGNTDPGY